MKSCNTCSKPLIKRGYKICCICKQSNHKSFIKNGKCGIKCFTPSSVQVDNFISNEKEANENNEKRTDEVITTTSVLDTCPHVKLECTTDVSGSSPMQEANKNNESITTTEMSPVLDSCPQVKLECTADVLGSSPMQEPYGTYPQVNLETKFKTDQQAVFEADLALLPNGSVYKKIPKGYWWINEYIPPRLVVYQFIPNRINLSYSCKNKRCISCDKCYHLEVSPRAFVSSVKNTHIDDPLFTINEKKSILSKWKVFLGI